MPEMPLDVLFEVSLEIGSVGNSLYHGLEIHSMTVRYLDSCTLGIC